MLMLAVLSHVATGVLVLATPPQTRGRATGVEIPDSATCLRVTRHADYSTVDVVVGTPPVQVRTLLRLDGVKGGNSSDRALRFYSQGTVESKTVTCQLDGFCTDVLMKSTGSRDTLSVIFAEFGYRHVAVERSLATTASQLAEVEGEFHMREGYNYWLTATHLCYSDRTVSSSGVPVVVDGAGSMVAARSDLLLDPVLGATPAAQHAECGESNVTLFPEIASLETSWISIADTGMYNSEPDSVEARRTIAEVGVACASNKTSLQRQLTLYELDCTPYSSCRSNPTVPFRRASTSSLFVSLQTNGGYYVRARHDETLVSLPRLANSMDALLSSLLKMLMITLAAGVVYVRSSKRTASSSWLIKNCLSLAHRKGALKPTDGDTVENETEDRVVGFLAITGRVTLVAVRLSSLSLDGQLRVCVGELIGACLSIVHYILRYGALVPDKDETPISKLGGSTAVIDSTAAVMIAFSQPPTMSISASSFDPTARMLVGLLISVIVVPRCAFSASCCGVLAPEFLKDGRKDYALILQYAGFTWCLQSAILAVTSCDLFIVPSAYSMSRATPGNSEAMLVIRVCLFLALCTAGLPRIVATARHILSAKEHID